MPRLALRTRLVRQCLRALIRTRSSEPLVRLGTAYGGWWVPRWVGGPGMICYLAGAGEDISFDAALVEAGSTVVTIDPTPRAIAYVEANAPSGSFDFVPVGLAGVSGTRRFYAPRDDRHVSHSMSNLQRTSSFFEAECRTLRSIACERGHHRIDLVKLDIEGAEYEVIESMLRDRVLPRVLCVEFDQPMPIGRVTQQVRVLRAAGYCAARVEGFNVTFLREPSATSDLG